MRGKTFVWFWKVTVKAGEIGKRIVKIARGGFAATGGDGRKSADTARKSKENVK